MIVTTIGPRNVRSFSLPKRVKGQYWLPDPESEKFNELISIEGIEGQWILKSNRNIKVLDSHKNILKSVILEPLKVYILQKADNSYVYAFVEPITEDRQIFSKYLLRGDARITVGRTEDNDICYRSPVISSLHAVLIFKDGRWFVQDDTSSNGTFVNEMRVSQKELHIGDTLFIMGLRIVTGKNLIAINNPDGKVSFSNKFIKFVSQEIRYDEEDDYELPEEEFFYRSPRFKRDVERAEFKIDSPPNSPINDEMPWILVMGSSMAMGMMSLITLTTAIATKNYLSMAMGASMLLGTVFLPIITKKYEKNRKHKKEALRQKKYREYLESVAAKINEECRMQEQILRENYVPVEVCENRILDVQRNLWERGFGQNDFLKVRIGVGEGELDADIKYAERRFSIDDDNLEEELYTYCEAKKKLHDIPITYSIYDNNISGVIGKKDEIYEFAKGLIMQLAAFYSYDEVKFVFLYENEDKEFEFVKWLPHVWSDENKFRFIATNANEAKELSAYLENIIEERLAMTDKDLEDAQPYYIVFSANKNLAVRTEMFKKILKSKSNLNISIVTFYEEIKDLPKECSMVVELNGESGRLYDKNDISCKSIEFKPDINLTRNPLELSVSLANTPLDTAATSFKLPHMITFLEMFGVGKVEHLNALNRWKENNPVKSLEAAVGVDTYGDIFKLDLHEKFHGPHGLVAGMTGSGKSEFIITYILSLAVNYHPDEVAFILIDYKGGGMAKSFENLPHTAGIITNLDGAAIKRSLVSIESELKRRQAIFAKVSKELNISNIDIYKYQKLRREGKVSEPLQHLFIISDEFAELKTQQPEFMTQLVSAARIGRSLGVHLILATQKPNGVVDDQIWSNSKFRVCLKVQERADSMDMLKRPDAAELTDTGRFYLQVGYNELFELGQSAWSGAPYYPSDTVQKEKDNSIVVIDRNGHPIKQVKMDNKHALYADAKKQLDVITEYLRNIAAEENIKIRPLWLEPIPAVILLDDIKKKYGTTKERYILNPVIGEYDDPARQRQCVLRLPLSRDGNTIVYGVAGSGKTTFFNAMLCSLIKEHTPDEVNMYILDFASETLRAFEKAPHVGDVILSYEAEKINNLFKMLRQETARRKKIFADYGGDYESYISQSGHSMPSIVVAINNFAAFAEMYEDEEDAVTVLTREGTKYGLYFVITSLGINGVRFRLVQNFKQMFCMQLNDESDYSSVVGKIDGLYPSKFKGRGLVKTDGLYEFQIASITRDSIPYRTIESICVDADNKWTGERARKVPILPDVVDIDFLKSYINRNNPFSIPIGVEKATLNVHNYPFGDYYVNIIMSASNEYQDFVEKLSRLVGNYSGLSGVVFDMPKSVDGKTGNLIFAQTAAECESEVSKLFELVLYRNNTYKTALAEGRDIEKFEKIVVFINSLSALRAILTDKGKEKLGLILEKGTTDYNICIIIGDQSKTISGVIYENWYKAHGSETNGIWVGNGITQQYNLKASRVTREMREEIPDNFGYSIVNGKCVKVKLLYSMVEEDTDE